MKQYSPGPNTSVFGGVPTGVANAQEAATAIAIITACGLAPIPFAIAIAIGANNAQDAVLDMNCVKIQDSKNKIAVAVYGLGSLPINAITPSAIILPAPDLSIAVATGIMPANKKIVTQSIDV